MRVRRRVTVTATNSAGSASATSSDTAVVSAAAPSNTTLPSISGSARWVAVLLASPGVWTGSPAPSFAYQWSRCDSTGANCVPISGATASTYTAVTADAGSTLAITVTATNSAGSASATSSDTAVVSSAPTNTTLPSISGSDSVGGVLLASPGVWTGSPAPSFAYQWSRCDSTGANCVPISGATASTYTAVTADDGSTLEVTVTATNSAGSASATSSDTAVVSSAPTNTTLPSISGSDSVGGVLLASPGVWTGSPAPSFAYQWSRCDSTGANCVPISGATASTYTAVTADDGSTLEVTVTATNSAGSASATSAVTAVVSSAPINTTRPVISGTAARGRLLTASTGGWTGTPTPTFSYQWSRCSSTGKNCVPISGATASTYTAVTADAGSTLAITVTATNSAGSASATSAVTAVVSSAPINTTRPVISGTAARGRLLTASTGGWTGTPTPTFSYQWSRCSSTGTNCHSISGKTSSGYTVQLADVGFRLEVTVTAKNLAGSAAANSALTATVVQTGALPNVQPNGRAGKIGAILTHGGYSLWLRASPAGRALISWTMPVTSVSGAGSGAKARLVATGRAHLTRPGTIK